MNTLTINSKAAQILASAAERARAEKPLVRKTSAYGVYTVLASDKTKEYTVTCNSVTREITCSCPARKPCKHIAAVAPIHSYIARQRRDQAAQALAEAETEAANWPLPVELSAVPSFDNATEVASQAAPALTWSDEETEQALAQLPPVEVARARSAYRNPGDQLPGSQYDLPATGRCPHCKRPFMSDEYDCYFVDCPGKTPARPVEYTPEMAAKDTADIFG